MLLCVLRRCRVTRVDPVVSYPDWIAVGPHCSQVDNLDVFGFELNSEEMAQLDALEEGFVTAWDPIANDPV